MSERFWTGSREQAFLLPRDMREWLPPDHLVWAVCEAVERLDFLRFECEYREDGQGRPAYEPRLMATVLLYAYAVGERSSRAIERRCREDVAFRVAACGLQPDHVTIARFRRRHADALIGLFSGVLALCAEAGLVRVGLIAIDGTTIRANANPDRVVAEFEGEARRFLAEAERADADEDALGESEQTARRGLLPAGFADQQARRERFEAAAERLADASADASEASAGESTRARPVTADERGRARANARRGKRNRTDPDSRILRTRGGFVQGYNAQVAVDESHLVVACSVVSENGDYRQLTPMIERTEQRLQTANVEHRPGVYLADGGYWSGPAVDELQADGRRLLLPPTGRRPVHGRRASPTAAKMRRRLAHPANRRRYKRRQALVEPVIAHLKYLRRFDRLLLRGLAGAELEWTLACTAHNLTRLARTRAATA